MSGGIYRQDYRLSAEPLTVAHHHHGIAIEDVSVSKRVADTLAKAGVIRPGQKPV